MQPRAPDKETWLWLHPGHRPAMRHTAIIVAALVLGVVLAWALPPLPGARGIAGYLPLHTLLETGAIVIAMLVFAVGWNAYSGKLAGSVVLLACAFLGVGLLDFSHVMSYAGMPDFVTPSGPDKAIDFWLAARALAAAALLAVAVAPWRPFTSAATRYALLAAVLAMTSATHWLFLFHPHLLPPTFVPGQGLTALKINAEYLLIALNLAAALALWLRMRKPQPFNAAALFGAVCAMALSEFFFTLYADVTDIFNLLGHLYKIVSYLFIYRAIFVATVETPYRQLSASQGQLQATHDALPDLLLELGLDGHHYDYHAPRMDFLAKPAAEFIGKTLFETQPPEVAQTIISALRAAKISGYSRGEYELELPQGKRWFEFSVARKPDDPGLEPRFIVLSRDVTERKTAESQIYTLAYYDGLTKLPNRRLLEDRLQLALATSARDEQFGAVLFLDLDQFKTVNETKGYGVGNLLLTEVARRLETQVRDGDTVARIGADEFIVILEALSPSATEAAAQAWLFAEKMQAALSQPYQLQEYTHHLTPSIGIAMFKGQEGGLEDLLKHAEVAMQQAKTSGRNAIRFHDRDMQVALEARAALESELRRALDKQQFHLHYQIQVDSRNRALGAEALIRWIHPERGIVPPNQFIPLAEETGLILPIGLWVLQSACTQLKAWQHAPLTRDLVLAVNVSARQLHQGGFVSQVQRALLESGARPSQLKLELTESMLLENVDDTIAKMRELRLLGVHFSMDDFGTGYSSLQYIKRLPLDQLKIDQSFVRDISEDTNDATIVQTIIAMGDALGLNVIAEGVETEAQREFLGKRGCHAFQGYLFGKPLPLEQFEALLQQR